MNHISIALPEIELLDIEPSGISPLISKCQIKVCYVGDEPNRNRSIITKETAIKMAPSLRGAAIVGHYNESTEDFEEHNRMIEISNGEVKIKDTTRPYGFVDLNAKVWFQKFLDDNKFEHEYLMTEGYIWTGQYPEAKRIIEKGNNQSMELAEDFLDATWTKDNNGKPQFFIINEAIISKLCILGDDCEPCFEGAQITKFTLAEGFEEKLFAMMNELKEILKEGGTREVCDSGTALIDENIVPSETLDEVIESSTSAAEPHDAAEELETEYKKKKAEEENEEESEEDSKEEESEEEKCPECGKPLSECECDKKKKKYNLDEVVEYTELKGEYEELEGRFSALETEYNELQSEIQSLREFKKTVEKKEKQAMIDQFYMLSDEDKADVIANIDTYSIDDIEAKLSILCVRNKVSFDLDEDKDTTITTYTINSDEDESVPAWVQALRNTAKTMN